MKDFILTKINIEQFNDCIYQELELEKAIVVSTQSADTGKWGMARLWRAWMSSTADFMASRGSKMPLMIDNSGNWFGERPFNSSDAHELFTAQWLCLDKDGERLSWSKSGRDGMRAATKGERFLAMQKHESWCIEKGIRLFKPKDSEYVKLEGDQNG